MALSKQSLNRIIRKTLAKPGAPSTAFAILDSARDARIYGLLLRPGVVCRALMAAQVPESLRRALPYLVTLNEAAGDLRATWRDQGHRAAWGILVHSEAATGELVEHFRGLFTVELPDRSTAYFRYYDPRVLRTFLPTCSPEQLRTIFGPVDAFVCEDIDGSWTVYSRQDGALAKRPAEAADLL